MKRILLAAVLGGVGTYAAAGMTGSFGVASEYNYRGISQSDEDVVIQGEFRYDTDMGAYASVWGSNVSFGEGSIELDYTVGFAGDNGTFNYDIGAIYYDYPNAETSMADYYEFFVGAGTQVGAVDVGGKVSYSDDFFFETGQTFYYEAEAGVTLPFNVMNSGVRGVVHVGYTDFDEAGFFSSAETSYTDYSVGVEVTLAGLDTGVYYIDTDLDDTADCGGTGWCDSRVLLTVGTSF